MKTLTTRIPLLLIIAAAATLTACGDSEAVDPHARADASWISISGTVDAVAPDRFTLDYGEGLVTVEMDDGDRDADAYKLLKGDKVTVHGMVDNDLFEVTTIEAASVYVEKLDTTFYASSVDEEGSALEPRHSALFVGHPVVVAHTVLEGTVTSIDAEAGEFVLSQDDEAVRVSVESLPSDPLDDEGYVQLERGDRVSVTGYLDSDLFEGHGFRAKTLVKLAG